MRGGAARVRGAVARLSGGNGGGSSSAAGA